MLLKQHKETKNKNTTLSDQLLNLIETLHIEVESMPLAHIQCIYITAHFPGLATALEV
jgi:hypothetical protein